MASSPSNSLLLNTYRLCLVLPLVWAITSYGAWLVKGCRPFLPFLSDFDIMQPEGTIFTFGATLQGLALLALLLQVHRLQHLRIQRWKIEPGWAKLNHFSLLPGGISTLSCIGLAWVPWNDYLELHRNLALAVFGAGVFWGASSCLLSWRFGKQQPRFRHALRLRLLASTTALACLGGLLWCMTTVFARPDFDREAYLARTYVDEVFCHNTYDPLLNMGAVFEWLLIGALFFAIATLRQELEPDGF